MRAFLETLVEITLGIGVALLGIAFIAAIYGGIGFLLMTGGLYAYKLVMGG